MIISIRQHLFLVILLLLSLITHFSYWSHPKEAVFDEVYFTSFASSYLTHNYYFDLHPPFAKLLITGLGMIIDIPALEVPLKIGDTLPDGGWIYLRLIPLLCGTLLPLIVYGLCRKLRMSEKIAFIAGLLIILENSILIQSRFILLDSILLFFGFLGLLLYFSSREDSNLPTKIAAIISLSFAFSVKWTGASFIAIAFMVEFCDFIKIYRGTGIQTILKQFFIRLFMFGIFPLFIYASFFTIHFNLLYKSGPGDDFMSPLFQKTLEGNLHEDLEDLRSISFIEKFIELNIVMFESNIRLDAKHDYGSVWYTWPIQGRSIFYWQRLGDGVNSFIYYLGNPLIYLLSLISVITLTLLLLIQKIYKNNLISNTNTAYFILLGYVMNLLPFMGIGRVMFLYHYQAALVFGIIATAFLVSQIPGKYRGRITIVIIATSLLLFIHFLPLTYGLPIKEEYHGRYFWFKEWR